MANRTITKHSPKLLDTGDGDCPGENPDITLISSNGVVIDVVVTGCTVESMGW